MKLLIAIVAWLVFTVLGTVVCIPPAWIATGYIEERWIQRRT